jgi:hypothetical protein
MKTHWLFGMGPNKEVKFNVEVDVETTCKDCIHIEVCDQDMNRRCSNYRVGEYKNVQYCSACIHHYTRFDKDETKLPCFHCKWHLSKQDEDDPRLKYRPETVIKISKK